MLAKLTRGSRVLFAILALVIGSAFFCFGTWGLQWTPVDD